MKLLITEQPCKWTNVPLGYVAEILSGMGFPKHLQGSINGDLPVFKVGDISASWQAGRKILTKSGNNLTREEARKLKGKIFPAGTIVFAKIGEALRLNRRAILGQPSLVDNNVMGLVPKGEVLESKYLFYFMLTVDLGDLSRATAVPSVRKSDVEEIPIPLPSFQAQTRIVAEIEKQFSRLDEAVANLKRVKANLKRYKAAVLKAAVEGKLTEEWRRGTACRAHDVPRDADQGTARRAPTETGSELLQRILAERRKGAGKGKYKEPVGLDASGLPELPTGWVWASGEQLFEWSSGDFLPANKAMTGEVPVYGGNGISGYHDTANINFSTIIIGRVGAQCGNIHLSVGLTWVTDNAIYAKRLPADVLLPYVSLVLTVENLNKKAAGSGQPFVNQKMLNAISVPLPPLAEQHLIVAEVERRLSIVAGAEAQVDTNLRRANRLRQSILKQAFSGQLVPQDPNDEPASVLLERIRHGVGARHAVPRTAPKTRSAQPRRAQHAVPLQKTTPAATGDFTSLDTVLAAILVRMQPAREYSRADLADPLGLSTGRWNAAIQELKRRGQVRQVGERRGARYTLSSSYAQQGGGANDDR